MANISTWSTTAANNNNNPPDGWPENMAPSAVNDAAREMMASVRTWYEDAEWTNFGYTHTYASGTSFTIAGADYTTEYHVGRRLRAVGSSTGTIYGTITASSFSTNTTVTIVWDSGSLSNETLTVSLAALSANNSAMPGVEVSEDDWTHQGNVTVEGTLGVTGAVTLSSTLAVTGALTAGTLTATTAPLPRSWLAGLALSRDAGDTDHDIAIAVGAARDDTDAADLRLAAVLTKQIDAAWSVGDDAGGMDTGTVANSTWYAVWLIRRSDTGVVDALFSTSGSSPTMPTNYDQKRRIGWVLTDGTANIRPFVQTGDRFEHLSPDGLTLDANGASVTTTESTVTVSNAPASSQAILNVSVRRSSESAEARIYPTDVADAAVASNASPLPTVGGFATGSSSNPLAYSTQMQIRLDASQQIHARASTTGVTLYALAVGWIDRRGRDD